MSWHMYYLLLTYICMSCVLVLCLYCNNLCCVVINLPNTLINLNGAVWGLCQYIYAIATVFYYKVVVVVCFIKYLWFIRAMSIYNRCVWVQHAGDGAVLNVASAKCMDSTPLCWFKVQRRSWSFLRPRSPCYSAWCLLEHMSIHISMRMSEPLWGVGTPTTRRKHITKILSLLVYHEFTYVTQTQNPFVHQCSMSTYASASYQPYNGNEWRCVQHDV